MLQHVRSPVDDIDLYSARSGSVRAVSSTPLWDGSRISIPSACSSPPIPAARTRAVTRSSSVRLGSTMVKYRRPTASPGGGGAPHAPPDVQPDVVMVSARGDKQCAEVPGRGV